MTKRVKFTVKPGGKTTIVPTGTKGKECEKLCKPYQDALGTVTGNQPTGDAYVESHQQATESEDQK